MALTGERRKSIYPNVGSPKGELPLFVTIGRQFEENMIEVKEIEKGKYEIKFNIAEKISNKTGIPKEKVAEFLADEFMKLFGFK